MPSFHHGEVEIAYLDEGAGEPIVLVHGFASTKEVNWVNPGWVATLTGAGRRAIALDNRGHGASSKLYDPAAYHSATMAEDVRALLDHLRIERADVMGYSMGARIAAFLAVESSASACVPSCSAGSAIAGGGRRPVGEHRRRAGGAVARRRQRPDRPRVPLLRRADQIGLEGARRLHPRLAPDLAARAGRRHPRPGPGCGRDQ